MKYVILYHFTGRRFTGRRFVSPAGGGIKGGGSVQKLNYTLNPPPAPSKRGIA